MLKLKIFILFLVTSTLLLLNSCKEEEETHPVVATVSADVKPGLRVLLKGNILALGSAKVLDYGFIIDNGYESKKLSINKNLSIGIYELEAVGLSGNNDMRAYLTNEKGTTFGGVINFIIPFPNISEVSPSSGKAGDIIMIKGDFSIEQNFLEVKFGDVKAKVIKTEPESILVEVPKDAHNDYYNSTSITISVKISSTQVLSSSFNLIPTIVDFEPKGGARGSIITFTGHNLSYLTNDIYFNNTKVSVRSLNNNYFSVEVPTDITTKTVKLKVVSSGFSYEFNEDFTILPPLISSFTPVSGIAGNLISVFGHNFEGYTGKILVGEKIAYFNFISPQQIDVYIPYDLKPGPYKINISNDLFNVSSEDDLTVVTPIISDFFPKDGAPSTEVTITGENLFVPGYSSHVYLDNDGFTLTDGNSNSLTFTIPFAITPGTKLLKVVSGGQTAVAESYYTVPEPVITGISPERGTPGTRATITGSGFCPYTSYNTVAFGNIGAEVISSTITSLEIIIPSNTGTGEKFIDVRIGRIPIKNAVKFTVE